jgi:hypothetical protein
MEWPEKIIRMYASHERHWLQFDYEGKQWVGVLVSYDEADETESGEFEFTIENKNGAGFIFELAEVKNLKEVTNA